MHRADLNKQGLQRLRFRRCCLSNTHRTHQGRSYNATNLFDHASPREFSLAASERQLSKLSFLRSHPKLSGESVPWHLHSADETAAAAVNK
jgi:hypothetical protein